MMFFLKLSYLISKLIQYATLQIWYIPLKLKDTLKNF